MSPADLMQLAGNAFNGGVVSACMIASKAVLPWSDLYRPSVEIVSDDAGGEESEEGEETEISDIESAATPVSE